MEPLLELADRITAHIWFLHEVSPDENDFKVLSAQGLSDTVKQTVAADWAKLEAVRDLADVSCPDDPNPDNPLPHVPLESRLQRQRRRFWDPFGAMRFGAQLRDERRDRSLELRVNAADEAFVVLRERSAALAGAGLAQLSVFASVSESTEGAENRGRYLTSDELFERVARWLLSLEIDKQCDLARSFVPLPGETVNCSGPRNSPEEPTGTSRRSTEGSIASAASGPGATRFLLEAVIDSRAHSIEADPSGRSDEQKDAVGKWLAYNDEQRLRVLLDRPKLRKFCRDLDAAVPFSIAMSDELDEIHHSRRLRLFEPKAESDEAKTTSGDGAKEATTKSKNEAKENKTQSGNGASEWPTKDAFDSRLFGLALSGGGIRSATFGLGLLQGMADRNILPYIDIISSVSGGGYIASWLSGWIKRRGSIKSVQDSLKGYASPLRCPDQTPQAGSDIKPPEFKQLSRNQDPHADHLRPVRLLREYARYLAPQAGLLSADTWTILTTWLRNTVLNLLILMLVLGAALLLPRVVIFALFHSQTLWRLLPDALSRGFWLYAILVVGFAPFLYCCRTIGKHNLQKLTNYSREFNVLSSGFGDPEVVSKIVLPLLAIGALDVDLMWYLDAGNHPTAFAFAFLTITVLGMLVIFHYSDGWKRHSLNNVKKRPWLVLSIFAFISAASFLLMIILCIVIARFSSNALRGLWVAGTFGPALLMLAVGTTILVFQGLSGTALSDEQREWWSRLGAWLLLTTLAWVILSVICFFMPLWIALAGIKIAAAGIAWGSLTIAGVKLAFSATSSGKEAGGKQSKLVNLVLGLAPSVFVVGLLSFTSLLMFWTINWFIDEAPWQRLVDDPRAHQLCCTNVSLVSFERTATYYWPLMNANSIAPLVLAIILFLLSWYLAWRVDVNEFSMHHFYCNRLVRAYLGASRTRVHRVPNAFTGFDMEDDIPLKRLRIDDENDSLDMITDCRRSYDGPFLIINTALNVTKGQDLGMQERRAEAFFFSPLWSGFDFSRKQTRVRKSCLLEFGFRRTDRFGRGRTETFGRASSGPLLGTAMAISGAAFSSNAGFHTSPQLAFLLTVFGVRLGWWAGNPRLESWSDDSPPVGLLYLLRELTANTTTDDHFVLLTDGGHFENMGLYELVRRRCRFIILSDAEEDREFKLEGIGGAIRKCRNDFGVVISLNLEALQPVGNPARSLLHYSVGTIRYPGEKDCGTLIYIKSSLTDDEPVDLAEFGKRHPEFPHTSTANQFFDESHFESYRELGHHIASIVFQCDMCDKPVSDEKEICAKIAAMFKDVESGWTKALEDARKRKQKQAAGAEDGKGGEA